MKKLLGILVMVSWCSGWLLITVPSAFILLFIQATIISC